MKLSEEILAPVLDQELIKCGVPQNRRNQIAAQLADAEVVSYRKNGRFIHAICVPGFDLGDDEQTELAVWVEGLADAVTVGAPDEPWGNLTSEGDVRRVKLSSEPELVDR